VNVLNMQPQTADKGWGLGGRLTPPSYNIHHIIKCYTGPWCCTDSMEQSRQQKMYEIWNIESEKSLLDRFTENSNKQISKA
jgi:hypothetical protein